MTSDVEVVDASGLSPLQQAVLSGNLELVNGLLNRGADANRIVRSADGRIGTALLSAVTLSDTQGRTQIVRALLDAGARTDAVSCGEQDLLLRSILEHARQNEDLVELVRLLLSHGARPDQDLLELAQKHSLFTVEYLLRCNDAASVPVEETGGSGGCLLLLALFGAVAGMVVYYFWQYLWF